MFVAAFFAIERATPTEGYWITDTPIDDAIPFVPQFVWFYILWYPLFAAVGIPTLIWDGPAFKRWMYYTMAVLTATLIFDVAVPNGQGLRPADMEVNSLSAWMLSLLWRADTPTNVFPSMHVLGCIGDVACAFDSGIFKRWRWPIAAACLLCGISTVLVKQHAWIDTLGAFFLAAPVFFAVYGRRFFGRRRETLEQ